MFSRYSAPAHPSATGGSVYGLVYVRHRTLKRGVVRQSVGWLVEKKKKKERRTRSLDLSRVRRHFEKSQAGRQANNVLSKRHVK